MTDKFKSIEELIQEEEAERNPEISGLDRKAAKDKLLRAANMQLDVKKS